MTAVRQPTPRVVLGYGLLGVIPFLGPLLAGTLLPAVKPMAALILVLYGGLILSFLGGARFGIAIVQTDPSAGVVSLAMIPTLAGLALLALPSEQRWVQLVGLAVALALHWVWDVTAPHLPAWYPRLRTILSIGAILGLLAGAVSLT